MTTDGKIIDISKTTAGSVHDIKIRRNGDTFCVVLINMAILAIRMAEGVNNVHCLIKAKNGKLTDQQRKENKEHSKIRIAVEHQFAQSQKISYFRKCIVIFVKASLEVLYHNGIVNLQAGLAELIVEVYRDPNAKIISQEVYC